MKALDKGYHIPLVLSIFAAFFTYNVARDLSTGEIWRGGPVAKITLVKDAAGFYVMIVFFSVMALVFWGGTLWSLFQILRRRDK